jgi:hypothetical protein
VTTGAVGVEENTGRLNDDIDLVLTPLDVFGLTPEVARKRLVSCEHAHHIVVRTL